MPVHPHKRIRGVSLSRGIVIGSMAQRLEKPLLLAGDQPYTHQWTVFVRGAHNEDLSFIIRRVQFKLHDTYPNPVRNIDSPPFEVTETGWGEFEIPIKIYFTTGERGITVNHLLKLHPLCGPDPTSLEPIVFARYDEMLFCEPLEATYEVLMKHQDTAGLPEKNTEGVIYSTRTEVETLEKIEEIRKRALNDERAAQEKVRVLEEQLMAIKAEYNRKKMACIAH